MKMVSSVFVEPVADFMTICEDITEAVLRMLHTPQTSDHLAHTTPTEPLHHSRNWSPKGSRTAVPIAHKQDLLALRFDSQPVSATQAESTTFH